MRPGVVQVVVWVVEVDDMVDVVCINVDVRVHVVVDFKVVVDVAVKVVDVSMLPG